MNIAGHDIAVCSWSLQPRDTGDLIASIKRLGLSHVQLALWPLRETYQPLVVYFPRTWLLRIGWRKGGGPIPFRYAPSARPVVVNR